MLAQRIARGAPAFPGVVAKGVRCWRKSGHRTRLSRRLTSEVAAALADVAAADLVDDLLKPVGAGTIEQHSPFRHRQRLACISRRTVC